MIAPSNRWNNDSCFSKRENEFLHRYDTSDDAQKCLFAGKIRTQADAVLWKRRYQSPRLRVGCGMKRNLFYLNAINRKHSKFISTNDAWSVQVRGIFKLANFPLQTTQPTFMRDGKGAKHNLVRKRWPPSNPMKINSLRYEEIEWTPFIPLFHHHHTYDLQPHRRSIQFRSTATETIDPALPQLALHVRWSITFNQPIRQSNKM